MVLSGADGSSAFASLRLLQAMAAGNLESPWPGMRRKMQDFHGLWGEFSLPGCLEPTKLRKRTFCKKKPLKHEV